MAYRKGNNVGKYIVYKDLRESKKEIELEERRYKQMGTLVGMIPARQQGLETHRKNLQISVESC